MSEPKRVVPQSLEFPDSLGHATKKEKKREKGKQLAPSYRFVITLPESNDNVYSKINYAQLVKLEEKKRRKAEQRADDENATNGLDPIDLDCDDDEDQLREVARRFEAKYGTATAGRKRHKFDDDVDLGAGYDENDSFIDNTDAYDEIVPAEMTTAYGGFYINSGPLEFRPSENDDVPVQNCLNNINNNNNEDENSEDDENVDDDEEEANQVLKRLEKRSISSSDDEDDEEIVGVPPRKKYKPEENGEKKSSHEVAIKKKRKLPTEPSSEDGEATLNARKAPAEDKREILDLECSSEDQEERKRAKFDGSRTKSALGEKRKFDIKRFVKKSSSNGLDAKKIDLKKFGGKDSNIDDAIESVVNAGRAEDESSDTMDSGKSRNLAGTESECDEMDKEETPLPEPLPEDVKDVVSRLKAHVEKIKEGKGKLFDEFVNTTLLTLDGKLRMLNSPSARLLTYGHVAHFLRCSKVTLINRTKKLCLEDSENKVKLPLQRLKASIEGIMPTVVERYAKECQRITEEKSLEGSPAEAESSDAEASEKSKIPRKKFPWSTETKKLVYEIACARRNYFKIRKPRKESIEAFVANFMEAKVLPLWPGGWMRLNTLLKYSNPEPVENRKQTKSREASVPNSVIAASAAASANSSSANSSSARLDASVAVSTNSVAPSPNQERAKSPVAPSKHSAENPLNFSMSVQSAKAIDAMSERKHSGSVGGGCAKQRERNNESPVSSSHPENASSASCQLSSMAKISVVPTSQLMAQKPSKGITEKFNPMDLTSSSLSITPVNDYQKPIKSSSTAPIESKKDVISITPYNEPVASVANVISDSVVISPSVTLPSSRGGGDAISYNLPTTCATVKPVTVKRILPEISEPKSERRTDERTEPEPSKPEKKEKKRDRWPDEKLRAHESKKRRKEQKMLESNAVQQQQQQQPTTTTTTAAAAIKSCEVATIVPTPQQPSLTKEEQEQRQIEETMAATNFLSQIINDDSPRTTLPESRKDSNAIADDAIAGIGMQQSSEQDNDVQMVMRSLKELQELQEMKYSPGHSPIGGQHKPHKSSHQYTGYQDDYHRLYAKKEDKIRVPKEETPW